ASFVAPAELGDEAVPDIALFVGARGAVGVRPAQDGFVGLAGERAFFYLRIGDAEETAAAPVERELVLAEILRVIRRELTSCVPQFITNETASVTLNSGPPFKAVNSCPFSSNDTVMTWPFFSGMSSPA